MYGRFAASTLHRVGISGDWYGWLLIDLFMFVITLFEQFYISMM